MATNEYSFWQWFRDHSDTLSEIETGDEPIADELITQLHKINTYLTFEMSLDLEQAGRREFVISAGGIKEAFPSVIRLVEAAPPFDQWRIIAFRQPKEVDFSIQMGDYDLSPDDIWFSCKSVGDKFDVVLYIRDLNKNNMEVAQNASFILLDNALGEYATETKIGIIDHRPLPDNFNSLQLLPFSSISAVIR